MADQGRPHADLQPAVAADLGRSDHDGRVQGPPAVRVPDHRDTARKLRVAA